VPDTHYASGANVRFHLFQVLEHEQGGRSFMPPWSNFSASVYALYVIFHVFMFRSMFANICFEKNQNSKIHVMFIKNIT
jgi:hypothetical protein